MSSYFQLFNYFSTSPDSSSLPPCIPFFFQGDSISFLRSIYQFSSSIFLQFLDLHFADPIIVLSICTALKLLHSTFMAVTLRRSCVVTGLGCWLPPITTICANVKPLMISRCTFLPLSMVLICKMVRLGIKFNFFCLSD